MADIFNRGVEMKNTKKNSGSDKSQGKLRLQKKISEPCKGNVSFSWRSDEFVINKDYSSKTTILSREEAQNLKDAVDIFLNPKILLSSKRKR